MESTRVKKISIFILTLIGFITTIKLAMIYYDANFNPYALPSFCSVSDLIDCDGVAKTTESQFFGIPLAYWGMFLYSFIFLMLIADKIKNIKIFKFMEVFKNPFEYIASLGIISFAISMILLCVSLFQINKICILCAFTYALNLLIALVALDYKNGGVIKAFKQSILDFLDAIKNRAYLIAFVIVMLIAASGLTYTTITMKFAPQVKSARDFKEFVEAKTNKYAVSGNILGDKNAKVTLITYTDYRCPICFAYNIMVHKVAQELKGVQVIHKNLPLDMECNKYLKQPFHNGSCRMARYSIAAEKQGKLWDVNSLFFEKQPDTEEEIIEIVKNIQGLDINQLKNDANSKEVQDELLKEIDESYSKGINATPSSQIGQDVFIGIKPYSELKKWLLDAGAERK